MGPGKQYWQCIVCVRNKGLFEIKFWKVVIQISGDILIDSNLRHKRETR